MMRVAFYKHHRTGMAGMFDALIRAVTGGPYSHCELIFPDGMAYSASIQDGGCRFKQIEFDPARWDIVAIEVDCLKVEWFCIAEGTCGYDYPGAFRFLVPALPQSKKRWFCSEVCCAALQAGGLFPGVKAWQVHPNRLHALLTEGDA